MGGPCTAFQTSCIPGEAVSQPRVPRGQAQARYSHSVLHSRVNIHKDGPRANPCHFLSRIQLIFGTDITEWSENGGQANHHSSHLLRASGNQPNPSGSGEVERQRKCLWTWGTAHSKRASWGYHGWKFFSAVKCSLPIWQTMQFFLHSLWIIVGQTKWPFTPMREALER